MALLALTLAVVMPLAVVADLMELPVKLQLLAVLLGREGRMAAAEDLALTTHLVLVVLFALFGAQAVHFQALTLAIFMAH
jgi:hypothetical protein